MLYLKAKLTNLIQQNKRECWKCDASDPTDWSTPTTHHFPAASITFSFKFIKGNTSSASCRSVSRTNTSEDSSVTLECLIVGTQYFNSMITSFEQHDHIRRHVIFERFYHIKKDSVCGFVQRNELSSEFLLPCFFNPWLMWRGCSTQPDICLFV
jgi:hypothetical protein